MSKRSEAVFLHDGRGNMPTENSGDDLNYEICSHPGHRGLFPFLALKLSRETTAISRSR
jgi:hypothetical protein